MADRNEKYRKQMTEAAQPHVQEEIIAIGMLQPKGGVGAMGMSMGVSHLAGMAMRSQAKKNAGGMPHTGIYALTATTLHVFDAKPGGRKWKIKKHVASIPRNQFTASHGAGKMTDQITLQLADGDQISLEAMSMGAKGFNDDFIEALTGAPPQR